MEECREKGQDVIDDIQLIFNGYQPFAELPLSTLNILIFLNMLVPEKISSKVS
jgi:hypothetical protein